MELSKQPNHHYVKQVVLPDGKQIDVVYFDGDKQATNPHWDSPALHICPKCDSELVHPTGWDQVEHGLWAVEVRCPNCEWSETGVFDCETIEDFDAELDRGTDQLIHDLRQLERANMEEAIDRFSFALDNDYLVPEDF